MTPRIRRCAVALAVVLALTACGDDDDPAADGEDAVDVDPTTADDGSTSDGGGDGEDDEPVDETPDDAPDDGAAPGDDIFVERAVEDLVGASQIEPELARCIATAVLDAAGGAEAMRAAGLDEGTWFATSESFEELGLPADDDAVDGLADGLGGCGDGHELLLTTTGSEVSDAVRQCVVDAVDEATVRRVLALSIIRGQEGVEASGEDVFGIVRRCEDDAEAG